MDKNKQIRWWRWGRRLLMAVAVVIGVTTWGLIVADRSISWLTRQSIVDDPQRLPPMAVGLVLGTAQRTVEGRPNLYYRARIETAAKLYHQGRVRGLLLSGDNATPYYNEPQAMRKDLLALGVPDAHITLDYAGFRTLDSVVRAMKVFELDEVLIISQRFHIERALFIAQYHGLAARGFVAPDPPGLLPTRVRLREVLARVLAWRDRFTHRAPRFLGAPEAVRLAPLD